MQSVNPTPGEYRTSNPLDSHKGGFRWETVSGTILCDGIFGLRETYTWFLTHIGTGRTVGRYPTRRKAYEAAAQLAALKLPWDAKTLREWKARLRDKEGKKAVAIIEKYGYR